MIERLFESWDAAGRRPPWDWPKGARWGCWLGCVVLGAVMAQALWLDDWDAWQAQREASAQQHVLRQAVAQLRQQTARLQQRLQSHDLARDGSLLALLHGAEVSSNFGVLWYGLDGPMLVASVPSVASQTSVANAPQAAMPVRFWTARVQMTDRFPHWLVGWQRLNRVAPGARIVALDMQAVTDERVRVRLTVMQPVWVEADGETAGAAPAAELVPHDPFDHRAPATDAVAQQRLEQEALAQLRYVGRLHGGGRDQVLLRAPGGRDANALQTLSAGDGLGPHLGRLGAISDAAVQIDGAWQDARGVWRAQSVPLDFEGATP